MEFCEKKLVKTTGPLNFFSDGTVDWIHQEGDLYIATGVDTRGKRFRPIRHRQWCWVNGINLYRGTKWLERNGKRYAIQRIYN